MEQSLTTAIAIDELAANFAGVLESPTGLMRPLTCREVDEQGTHVTDLPAVVLGSILARLDDPVDVAAALCACRVFCSLARTAPFQLCLRPRQLKDTPGGSCEDSLQNSGRHNPQTMGFWTWAALCGIRKYMCATQKLDLAGCSIVDDDVAAILADLKCLDWLILDGCQKLTSAIADVIIASIRMGPGSISLQRCYRLGPASAGKLIVACAADGSQLRCLLLSHLDGLEVSQESLDDSREKGSEKEVASSDTELPKIMGSMNTGAGLRTLALNNCAGLGAPELTSVATLCPQLELLLLGGSVEGLGLSRAETLSQEKIAAAAATLIRTTELLPKLRVLELTFFTSVVVQAVREQDDRKLQVWDFCDEGSVAAAAWVLDDLKQLKHGTAINYLLRHIVSPVHCASSSPGRDTTPVLFSKSIRAQFWQDGLTLSECLGTGSFSYANFSTGGKSCSLSSLSQSEDKWESLVDDVALALRGVANCSDTRRRTPLHIAAARGDVPMIAGLLAIGAATTGMKDSSGATALFVAAESGYAHACELLLRGGADVLASNRAGETPLYIAALRGHSSAVGIMLAHCHELGVNWQDADVYGDGFTPLMAAAVADRRDVAEVLFWAAGAELGLGSTQEGKSLRSLSMVSEETVELKTFGSTISNADVAVGPRTSDHKSLHSNGNMETFDGNRNRADSNAVPSVRRVPQLLDEQNRWGHSALHIAAEIGSIWFVENLLSAGASLDVRNAYGFRAVDVAKKFNKKDVADILRRWEVDQSKTGRKKSSRKSRKIKAKASKAPTDVDPSLDSCVSNGDGIAPHSQDMSQFGLDEVKELSGDLGDRLIILDAGGLLEKIESSGHAQNGVHSLVQDAGSIPHVITDQHNQSYWEGRGTRMHEVLESCDTSSLNSF